MPKSYPSFEDMVPPEPPGPVYKQSFKNPRLGLLGGFGLGEIVSEAEGELYTKLKHPDRYAILKDLENRGYQVYASDWWQAARGQSPEDANKNQWLRALGTGGATLGAALLGQALVPIPGVGAALGAGVGALGGHIASNFLMPETAGSSLLFDVPGLPIKAGTPLVKAVGKRALRGVLPEAGKEAGKVSKALLGKAGGEGLMAKRIAAGAKVGAGLAKAEKYTPGALLNRLTERAATKQAAKQGLGKGALSPASASATDVYTEALEAGKFAPKGQALTQTEEGLQNWAKAQFGWTDEQAAREVQQALGSGGMHVPATVDAFRRTPTPYELLQRQLSFEFEKPVQRAPWFKKLPKGKAPGKGAAKDLGLKARVWYENPENARDASMAVGNVVLGGRKLKKIREQMQEEDITPTIPEIYRRFFLQGGLE